MCYACTESIHIYIYLSHICLVGTELNWERLVWFGSDGTYVSMHDAWHTTCFNLSLYRYLTLHPSIMYMWALLV